MDSYLNQNGLHLLKVVSRSISYREELNRGSRSTRKSIVALEDIFSSNKGSDQFLTLVCTADIVANRLRCRSINSEPKTSHRSTKATFEIDTNCGCSAVSEEGTEGTSLEQAISQLTHEDSESYCVEPPKRSRSWHSFLKKICLQLMMRTMAEVEIDVSGSTKV
ncbi:uncharacterized protein J3R85_001326 [Psidium guajava]|nr:uncharacterized protein J3R85_001326 [Psidium guajava]